MPIVYDMALDQYGICILDKVITVVTDLKQIESIMQVLSENIIEII